MPRVLDYGRSFVTFVTFGRENNARIQVESRCRLDRPDGSATEAWFVASCKAEDTYAPRDLFRRPNYDFCCVFTADHFRIYRTPLEHDPSVNEGGRSLDRFEQMVFQLREVDAVELPDSQAIVRASLGGHPLVGRCELTADDGSLVTLEYPIKTMNANDLRWIWQVDTGPLLVPAELPWNGDLAGLEMAFIACSAPDWAELICRRPTPVGEATVDFYGTTRVVACRNSLWATA
ncbi:MAG: hypothetical protein HYU66_23315 [Armatimonadetes bacterium]|nr:hypothetical protein [Armatimonadota bacterium]